jgi:hypothetical protein
MSGETTSVPGAANLSAWTDHAWHDGVELSRLSTCDQLTVTTLNSTYEIVMGVPGTSEVLVRGGTFFPEFMPARLAGSSLGGSFLKIHSVYVGFRIEFAIDSGCIVTSPVRQIVVAPAASRLPVM